VEKRFFLNGINIQSQGLTVSFGNQDTVLVFANKTESGLTGF